MKTELIALFSGYVQGCGFRYFTCRALEGHPVAGYVKNLADGTVELVLQGERDALLAALEAVKAGRAGRIQGVECRWREPVGDLIGFVVRY